MPLEAGRQLGPYEIVSANVAALAATLPGESSAAPLASVSQDDDATLVLTGLDPVMLTEGRKEQGKPLSLSP